jgi:hypothetical protein
MRRVVVFPDPDGPSIEKNSPSATCKLTPPTATTSPKRFSTFSSVTAGAVERPDSVTGAPAAVVVTMAGAMLLRVEIDEGVRA